MLRLIFISVFLFCFSFVSKGQDTLLIQTIKTSDTEKVNELLDYAQAATDAPVILRYLLEAQSMIEKMDRPAQLFEVYSRIGNIYQHENLHQRALDFFQKAVALPSPPISEKSKVDLYNSIAEAHFQMGQADSALLFYNKRFTYFEAQDNYEEILKTLQNQVNVFLKNKDYEKSLATNLVIKDMLKKETTANVPAHPDEETTLPEIADKKHLAIVYNNIGYNLNFLNRYSQAIVNFKLALELSKEVPDLDLAGLYTNIGIAYNNLNDQKQAIRYLLKAQDNLKKDHPSITAAFLQHLIATIYLKSRDFYNALRYNELALGNATKNKELELLKDAYNTAAEIHQGLFDYEVALDYYKKHLVLQDSFRFEERLRQEQLLQQQFLLERSEKEIRLLLINQEVQEKTIAQLQLEKENILLNSETNKLAAEKRAQELELLKKEQNLLKSQQDAREANLRNTQLEKERTQQELELTQQRLLTQVQEQAALEAQQKEEFARLEAEKAESEKKEVEIQNQLLTTREENTRLELERQESARNFIVGLVSSLFLLLLLAAASYWTSRRKNQKLEAQNKEIERSRDVIEMEKQKSEELLLNILPLETAKELKEAGFATPKEYEKVSVLFTDFSDFTKIAEKMSAEKLIEELNFCFRKFDEIIDNHGLEKIKTIGDGYMCAGGIPSPNNTNPKDTVAAAIEMQAFMQQRRTEMLKQGTPYWDMRIGIHTGNVIAGVVGTKKFAYDIWGDTVNTASRMESSGENGKINISDSTRQYLNGEFNCTYRGEMEVKNKDKVKMYFVDVK